MKFREANCLYLLKGRLEEKDGRTKREMLYLLALSGKDWKPSPHQTSMKILVVDLVAFLKVWTYFFSS